MTTAQISRITPPPSVEAVLGALTEETRIGQVDFSSRLAEPAEGDAPVDEATEAPADVAASDAAADEVAEDLEPLEDTDDPDDEHTAEIHTLAVAPLEPVTAPTAKKTKRRLGKKVPRVMTPEPATADAETDVPASVGSTLVSDPAAGSAHEEDDQEVTTRAHRPILPEPLDVAALLDTSEGVDERPPSIEEIARLVVERMHDAELAMMRHLEAVEVETARRAELATAQAELDAELIRLNARREAHAIVTAARRRAGQEVEVDPAQVELEEITESLTRFADVLEELRPSPRPGRPS